MASKPPNTDWDNWDFCIRVAGNTGPRALMALWQKGYEVCHWANHLGGDDYQLEFLAKKDGRMFSATGPEELLGLVAIWETRGEDWRETTAGEWDRYKKLMDESRVFDEDGVDVTDDE